MAAPVLGKGGLFFPEAEDSQTAITIYLPVSLRETDLLWLRTLWARLDEGAPPLEIGDVRCRIRIYTIDELTDTVTLGGTWDNDVTFSSVAIPYELHYYDIDINTIVDEDTTHLYIIYERTGSNPADTLEHDALFVNSYTLLTQEVEE